MTRPHFAPTQPTGINVIEYRHPDPEDQNKNDNDNSTQKPENRRLISGKTKINDIIQPDILQKMDMTKIKLGPVDKVVSYCCHLRVSGI